jgi:hypothetical protein
MIWRPLPAGLLVVLPGDEAEAMYCPSCGTQNKDDVRFCRKCGADLRVVAQAVTQRLSLRQILATRLDAYVEAKRRGEVENTGIANISFGSFLLIAGIYNAIFCPDVMQFLIITNAIPIILVGVRDRWVYKRSLTYDYHPAPEDVQRFLGDLSIYKPDAPASGKPSAATTRTVDETPLTELLPKDSPPSVTESTTRRFDSIAERPKEKL